MELFNFIGSLASIVSLILSAIVLKKVSTIVNSIKIKGDKNIIAGKDITMNNNE